MTDQTPSPWADSDSPVEWVAPPGAVQPGSQGEASQSTPTNWPQSTAPWASPVGAFPQPDDKRTSMGAGRLPHPSPTNGQRVSRRAIAVVALLCVVLATLIVVNIFTDAEEPARSEKGTSSEREEPPLAKLCPQPDQTPSPGAIPAPPEGPRLQDDESGISYQQWGTPFRMWDRGAWAQGDLGVEFGIGYYFVTETYSGGDYLASVLSGDVPATVGDSLTVNLECAGKQVAEDVRRAYYPQPNTRTDSRNEYTTLGGLPAWVTVFHLDFEDEGLNAKGETVAVVTVDVDRPTAAVLYVSIPDTHESQWVPQIDALIASIRPT